MEYEDKIDLVADYLVSDFNMTYKSARNMLSLVDKLDNIFFEYYKDELAEAEEAQRADWEYDREHYNDGWSDHIGV